MHQTLCDILGRVDADYADLRYELMTDTSIDFQKRELTEIGTHTTDGFVLRVLKNGGLASMAFTRLSDAERAIRQTTENAVLMGRYLEKPVALAPVEPLEDVFAPTLVEDPRAVSMDEKLELLHTYIRIPLAHEKIVTTRFRYGEIHREKWFVNTEGSRIHEDLLTTRLMGMIISKEGHITQTCRTGGGGSDGFQTVRGLEPDFEEKTQLALDLLKAEPVKAGTYNVVLNPRLTGLFAHEAFGHFSEADIIETLPAMREKMTLGDQMGSSAVNFTADSTIPHQLGMYRYDDEGVPVRRVELMREGVLTGRLHSRRTAAAFEEPVSGHCVAENYLCAPVVRMGTIFLEPGSHTIDHLLDDLGDGLYLVGANGGETHGDHFTFGAQHGYVVKNGKQGQLIRDINISGNLYQTLKDIVAVGDDLELSKVGGCGKGNQLNIRSSFGGPHTLINNLVVGGV